MAKSKSDNLKNSAKFLLDIVGLITYDEYNDILNLIDSNTKKAEALIKKHFENSNTNLNKSDDKKPVKTIKKTTV